MLLLVGAGFMLTTSFSTLNSLVQEMAPDELRGRVLSIFGLPVRGGGPGRRLAAGGVRGRRPAPGPGRPPLPRRRAAGGGGVARATPAGSERRFRSRPDRAPARVARHPAGARVRRARRGGSANPDPRRSDSTRGFRADRRAERVLPRDGGRAP